MKKLFSALLTTLWLCAAAAPAFALDRRLADAADDAEALFRSGDLEGASETLEQALAAATSMLGSNHPDVAELTSRLALLHLYRNDIGTAERLAERALALREKRFGELHPTVAASLMDLASIRLVQGRDDEAGELYRRVVDLWTRSAGPDDARTVQARANLADFLEARGQLAEAQELRGAVGETAESPPPPVPSCPVTAADLEAPAWRPALVAPLFRIALEHEERIKHALEPAVHHFSAMPARETFETVFPVDGEQAYEVGRELHALAKQRDPSFLTLLALIYVAREHLNVSALARLAPSPDVAPDFGALAAGVRRRALVAVTRFELLRTPGWSAWIDDAGSLLARRDQAAKLLRPVGFDVNNEIKYRPEFLACVAIARTSEDVDLADLRMALEVIARNAAVLDAYFRFAGIDIDAELKAAARAAAHDAGLEEIGPGVQLDRFNRIVFVERYPTSLVVHLQGSSRDRVADLAALLSQWEHGGFPRATRAQIENLVLTARRYADVGPFAELLDAVALDIRTRYPVEPAAGAKLPDWAQPRIGRWERTRVGREQHHTYYDLQFDTHGSFAVPSNDLYLTKRLASPVGMMLSVALHRLDLPKRALDVFAKNPPTLHVAVLPDAGLTFDLYAHPRTLTRVPGVAAIAFGETPLRPPPPWGWEVSPFGRVNDDAPTEDRVLLDVRPVPGIAPGEPKSLGLHVCLLTPLEAWTEAETVHFSSPIWRDPKDVPESARFVVYRRKSGARSGVWEEIAGPLSLDPGLDYPDDRVSPLTVGARNGTVEFSFTDHTAASGTSYEYRILHRCALKPYPDHPPGVPALPRGSTFEIVAVEHSPEQALRCNLQKGYGGIARPWVRVRYRVRDDKGSNWHDRVTVVDPDGHELSGRNAVTTRREPAQASPQPGLEYSLLTSVAACTEGPYRFRIRLEGDGFSQEVAETLYVSVSRDR